MYNEVVTDLTTKGWTIVDTSEFFEPMPNFPINAYSKDSLERSMLFDEQNLILQKYIRFLKKIVKIPNEKYKFSNINYRYMIPTKPGDYQHWHKDGAYIRTITPLSGASTEYLPSYRCRKPRIIPHKHTLIFTGNDRAKIVGCKCTLHRTPQFDSPRELLVGTFYGYGHHALL